MKTINKMYAFIADEDDGEGIVAFSLNGQLWPLVGADMARVDQLRPIAENIAKATGKKITLAVFETRTVLEVVNAG